MGNEWLTRSAPLIIGHRGASYDAPENTLRAFRVAKEQGADGIEFDVQLSSDGHAVIIHDETLDRTTNATGLVAQLTANELAGVDAGGGEPIARLDDVLAAFGSQWLYNIEIKAGGARAAQTLQAVYAAVERHAVQAQTLVSSFDEQVVMLAQQQLPQPLAVALLQGKEPAHPPAWFHGRVLHPHYSFIDQAYMHSAGDKRVNSWTVDDPDEARRLLQLGVRALITNRPGWLRQTLSL